MRRPIRALRGMLLGDQRLTTAQVTQRYGKAAVAFMPDCALALAMFDLLAEDLPARIAESLVLAEVSA